MPFPSANRVCLTVALCTVVLAVSSKPSYAGPPPRFLGGFAILDSAGGAPVTLTPDFLEFGIPATPDGTPDPNFCVGCGNVVPISYNIASWTDPIVIEFNTANEPGLAGLITRLSDSTNDQLETTFCVANGGPGCQPAFGSGIDEQDAFGVGAFATRNVDFVRFVVYKADLDVVESQVNFQIVVEFWGSGAFIPPNDLFSIGPSLFKHLTGSNVQGVGPGTSLSDKVSTTVSDYLASNRSAVCADLSAILNELTAQAGRQIDAATAQVLTLRTQDLILLFLCQVSKLNQ